VYPASAYPDSFYNRNRVTTLPGPAVVGTVFSSPAYGLVTGYGRFNGFDGGFGYRPYPNQVYGRPGRR
jgi:hypothetical protein